MILFFSDAVPGKLTCENLECLVLKKALYLSVNLFSMKVLFVDTIFTSPTGDGTANFIWSSEPCRGQAICRAKAVPSFLSQFKTTSVGPAPGIEPLTSCSAVKCSTNWAYPAVVNYFKPLSSKLSSDPSTCVSCI